MKQRKDINKPSIFRRFLNILLVQKKSLIIKIKDQDDTMVKIEDTIRISSIINLNLIIRETFQIIKIIKISYKC